MRRIPEKIEEAAWYEGQGYQSDSDGWVVVGAFREAGGSEGFAMVATILGCLAHASSMGPHSAERRPRSLG